MFEELAWRQRQGGKSILNRRKRCTKVQHRRESSRRRSKWKNKWLEERGRSLGQDKGERQAGASVRNLDFILSLIHQSRNVDGSGNEMPATETCFKKLISAPIIIITFPDDRQPASEQFSCLQSWIPPVHCPPRYISQIQIGVYHPHA